MVKTVSKEEPYERSAEVQQVIPKNPSARACLQGCVNYYIYLLEL
jgi:hypothetical protein